MSDKTVLVIDDSATIRKLVDSHLSPEGYRVVLAPNAEDGLDLAPEVQPDLILLDHQLPGTTGHQVATQLSETPELCHIPVVISSTLRKKAYAEYIDLDNVVDMLPKPYTEDLLKTTVANAIETAAMIVQSQSQGSAVPEIINATDEAALAGNLSLFSLRELLDFLNNGRKNGVLEVEAENTRIRFHLEKGRIQAVYAQGIGDDEAEAMASKLPASLTNLAPVFKMTLGGRSCAEVDGFVQLLDQKVLDPRLMSKLLRFQAAMLVRHAFTNQLKAFRFETGSANNALHKSLPLDISLLALLVEGAIYSEARADSEENFGFVRRAIRGQNLDRAGLSARHMKVLNVLADPKSPKELETVLGWDEDEVRQVLEGFELAELVERRQQSVAGQFVIFEPDANQAQVLRNALEQAEPRFNGKVVRDKLALQLVLKRSIPHTLLFSGDSEASCELMSKVFASKDPRAASIRRIALVAEESPACDWTSRVGFQPDAIVTRPCTANTIFDAIERCLEGQSSAATSMPAPARAEAMEQEFATAGAQV